MDCKINKCYNYLNVTGAAFIVVGVPLGMYLDFFFRIPVKWTNIFMVLSLLFLYSKGAWRQLLKIKFANLPVLNWIVLFQLFMIVYGLMDIEKLSQFWLFHFYVIAISVAFMVQTNPYEFAYLPEVIYYISIPCLVFGVFCCASGIAVGGTAYQLEKTMGEELYNLDTLTISAGALNAIFSMMCFKRKDKAWKILLIPTIIASGYILLICGKRTPIFMLIVGCFVYLFCKRSFSLRMNTSQAKNLILVVSIILVCYFAIPFVQEKFDNFMESFCHGVLSLFGFKDNQASLSVEERVYYREWAYNYIENEFTPANYLLGAGYYIRWLDFPIFQSYLDMGIMGLLLYGFIVVIYPLTIILKRIDDNVLILALLFTLEGIFGIFSTGHPYAPNVYVRVGILAFICYYYKKRKAVY